MTHPFDFIIASLFTGYDWIDRYQRQIHIPNPVQHAVQDNLVGERTAQGGGAIGFVGDRHAVEPLGPLDVQVPKYFDLVYLGCIVLLFISHIVLHSGECSRE